MITCGLCDQQKDSLWVIGVDDPIRPTLVCCDTCWMKIAELYMGDDCRLAYMRIDEPLLRGLVSTLAVPDPEQRFKNAQAGLLDSINRDRKKWWKELTS